MEGYLSNRMISEQPNPIIVHFIRDDRRSSDGL
jgi:hypothetical protein